MNKVLLSGAAGFIGFHTVKALLDQGYEVVGLDSINAYYDVNLKYARLEESGIRREDIADGRLVQSRSHPAYRFLRLELEDEKGLTRLFEREAFTHVVHLAAQAGVRYSLSHPHAYVHANISGFLNMLEACRAFPVKHLLYASSSSVYGKNAAMPFSTSQHTDHPVSLYAASKKANELMAHTYSHLYGLAATGLRFFTVYGPWGRPDMALFLFTRAILHDQPIQVFNKGDMLRDFTYVDDIVGGMMCMIDRPPLPDATWDPMRPDPAASDVAHRIYNIGHSHPVRLTDFIAALEKALNKTAIKELLPMQAGDVPATYADTAPLQRDFGYQPGCSIEEGIARFVEWYREYYRV